MIDFIAFLEPISRRGVLLGVTQRIRPIATMMPGGRTSAARRIEPCLQGKRKAASFLEGE
jgi:hypothetical protein